ncbi:VOC family protein [Jatrophihabitans sp. DSM 45814]
MTDPSPALQSFIEPGYFHRIGIAAAAGNTLGPWLVSVLGARPLRGGSFQLHGLPMHEDQHHEDDQQQRPSADQSDGDSAAESSLFWLANAPIAIFTDQGEEGPLTHYVNRYGPGLHSVAWTIDDIWKIENVLRQRGVGITGTDIPGRHFFMHPRDSAGVLIEWTDTAFTRDPRDGHSTQPVADPLIKVEAVTWLTAVVKDASKSAEVLGSMMTVRRVDGNPCGPSDDEETIDLGIGDMVVRLVSPRSDRSRYAAALAANGPRFNSFCLGVSDLDQTIESLAAAGIAIADRDGHRAWTDPASTLGLTFEWTDTYAPISHPSDHPVGALR